MNWNSNNNKYIFITTYQKDYVDKPIKRVRSGAKKQQFKDPIAEGFREYLVLNQENVKPPDENLEPFVDKFKSNYKSAGQKYFTEPLDKDVISKYQIKASLLTEYQKQFCDMEKDIEMIFEHHKHEPTLPEDTRIALTTYNNYFRDPSFIGPFRKPDVIIPPTTMKPSQLALRASSTEYEDYVGNLGGLIVKSMHSKWQSKNS